MVCAHPLGISLAGKFKCSALYYFLKSLKYGSYRLGHGESHKQVKPLAGMSIKSDTFQYFELVLIDCANHYVQICLVFFNRTLRCPWRRINEFIFSSRGGKNHQDSLFNQAKKVITRLRFLNALQAGFWVMKKPFPTWVYVVLIKWTRRLHSKIQNQQKMGTLLP